MQKLLPTHLLKFLVKVLKSLALLVALSARKLNAISLLTPSERKILLRNLQFKDKHKGKRAFVLVSGPSLKQQDISRLSSEITFVVSGFYRHEVVRTWQPTYYCIIDKLFFNGSDTSRKFFEQMNEVIKRSTFFLPLYRGYKSNQKFRLLAEEKTFYVATAGLPGPSIEMDGVIQTFASVSAFALAQAIYMGCSPIYLLGYDHDHLAERGVDRHFYSGGTMAGAAGNSRPLAEKYSYDQEMTAYLLLWRNYRSLKRAAHRKGIKIYNATHGGYLDVFERWAYEKIDFGNEANAGRE
jgi:hypothetical protein